eukprot:TRINITY_DN27425_c0_g1_i3.p1 TRINITY_DN27425_c0_g1~~TRINITY_DN27425_c0_g1_i3.p1  ORF type:complete len:400 (+),score=98.46 TRINITY_DN27425_c0_g1_i3:145-1344(+)
MQKSRLRQAGCSQVWGTELGHATKNIQRRSDFFELGGHSIVALRVCRLLAMRLIVPGAADGNGGLAQGAGDEVLGGDTGELVGALSPPELLKRPRLGDYAAYLGKEGYGAERREEGMAASVADASEAGIDQEPSDGYNAFESTELADASGYDTTDLLHRACAADAEPLVRFLIASGHTPVDGNSSMKRLKTATRAQRALRNAGKDGARPPAPLHTAAANNALESLKTLLELGAAVTATDVHGVMSLQLAAGHGSAEMVDRLLSAKSPLAARDTNMQTALHFAARSGNLQTTGLLTRRWLEDEAMVAQGQRVYGGPLDWRDRWHRTPVHWAALNDQEGTLRLLLEAKAAAVPPKVPISKHAKNTTLRHETPLEIAKRREQQGIVELLRTFGADDVTDVGT